MNLYFFLPHARPVQVKVGLVQAGSGSGQWTQWEEAAGDSTTALDRSSRLSIRVGRNRAYKPEAPAKHRATFGGTLAARELGFERSGSDRYLSLHRGLVTRVSGRTPFGAYCPKRSLAREASTLSLATCLPGFPGVVLIPLGRLSTSPIPLLRASPCGFTTRIYGLDAFMLVA